MSYIDNTWVAYAFDEPAPRDGIERSLNRVRAHYGELYAEPLQDRSHVSPTVGMALWRRDDPRLRWAPWIEDGGTVVASTNAVAGWETVTGHVDVAQAPLELGRALAADPERLAELTPPFVIAVLNSERERLLIVNDFLATARLYEMRTPSGRVWSNRLGALPLFAGGEPGLDPEGWAIHAAAGWFLGTTTPLRGAVKVRPGSAITVEGSPTGARIRHDETDAVRRLVAPRRTSLSKQAAAAADQSVAPSRSIGSIWSVGPTINLSGGRDSRISAAGAIAAGLDAKFRTMDIEPGEVEAARELLAAAPGSIELGVMTMDRGEPDDSLAERIGGTHLVHDGLANPMGGQSSLDLPQQGFVAPLVTGHGASWVMRSITTPPGCAASYDRGRGSGSSGGWSAPVASGTTRRARTRTPSTWPRWSGRSTRAARTGSGEPACSITTTWRNAFPIEPASGRETIATRPASRPHSFAALRPQPTPAHPGDAPQGGSPGVDARLERDPLLSRRRRADAPDEAGPDLGTTTALPGHGGDAGQPGAVERCV